MYEFTQQLAAAGRFLGTVTGTVPIAEFFAHDNIERIVAASASDPASTSGTGSVTIS